MQFYLILFLIRVSVVLKVNVWGPSDLKYLVDAMKSFIPNAAMVHTRSFGPMLSSDTASMPDSSQFQEPIVLIDDEVVKISAILLRPSCLDGSPHLNEEPVMQNPSERGLDERMDPNGKTGSIMKPGDMSVNCLRLRGNLTQPKLCLLVLNLAQSIVNCNSEIQ